MEGGEGYSVMSRRFERWYPWLFAIGCGALAAVFEVRLPNDDARLTALLSASISTSAILVGFLATVKAILMALPESSIKTQLSASGEMATLSGYLSAAMTSNLAFCVLNIATFFLEAAKCPALLSYIWIMLGVAALLGFWRVGQIMLMILRLV